MENTNVNKHIGNVFREYRLKNHLTQSNVAELIGVETRHISQIERGMSKGSIDTLIKLCNAYNITTDVVLFDLLDDNVKNSNSKFEKNFNKLSSRDKDIVNQLIEYLLNK